MLCGDSGLGLSRGNGADCHQELVVHCTGIVQKAANNFLDSMFACSVKKLRSVLIGGELGFGPIGDGCARVWRQPTFRRSWMIELDEEVLDVALHANSAAFVDVVPCDVHPGKFVP